MVEVLLKQPDDFLKVRETLTRIVWRLELKTNFISPVTSYIKSRYFIVHFKELFMLDGKPGSLSENDLHRRNRIARLLSDWNLVTLVNELDDSQLAPLSQIKILPYREKADWELIAKYSIGNKRKA